MRATSGLSLPSIDHFLNAVEEEQRAGDAVIGAIQGTLNNGRATSGEPAVFRAPPSSVSTMLVQNYLMQRSSANLDLTQLPPGFVPDKEGKLSDKEIEAIHGLVHGPDKATWEKLRACFDGTQEARGQKVLEMFGPSLNRLWQHDASIKEWKEQAVIQRDALERLLGQVGVGAMDSIKQYVDPVRQRDLRGLAGDIARAPYLNALMQDLLIVTANERAAYELSGVSAIYRPGDITVSDKRPITQALHLKRFEDAAELLKHVEAVHQEMRDAMAAGGEPPAIRSRASFAIRTQLHATSAELLTVVHEGEPKTAMLCTDGASAAKVAVELKALLDIAQQDKVSALVINSHTQHSFSDCPTYAVFHPEKLRNLAMDDASFDRHLHDLLDGKVNSAAYLLPWGKKEGAPVYFIENDNVPQSRILPLSVVKETQSGSALQQALEEREVDPQERQRLLERYEDSRPKAGPDGTKGPSTLMVDKAAKYFERAFDALENLEIVYGADKGSAVLKQLLDRVRQKGIDPDHVMGRTPDASATRELLVQHIAACKDNISILEQYERSVALSHQRYLIGVALGEEDEPEDPDESDDAELEKLFVMPEPELRSLDTALEKEEQHVTAALRATQLQCGKGHDFIQLCEVRDITSKTEAQKLAMLQAALVEHDDVADRMME